MASHSEEAQRKISPDHLRAQSDAIVRAVTDPRFKERVDAVLGAAPGKQFSLAKKTLTPAALKKAGIGLPEGVRISSRYFEEVGGKAKELGATGLQNRASARALAARIAAGQHVGISDMASWSVCVCVGVAACVGVGGGS
ncbi:MAG TPA: hypothetical protein VFZ91_13770 [Allosphingosinicella sp.]